MHLHRFYTGDEVKLEQDIWLHEEHLIHQWRNVLRLKAGDEIVLFDGFKEDRLYRLTEINDREVHLQLITELVRKVPARDVYLLWAVLKKDKNEWVMQKGTELGVSHFVPLLAERSEKTGLNLERARKIVIEAAEQCGRSDIPNIREPIHSATAIKELKEQVQLYICEQSEETQIENSKLKTDQSVGVLIGPEGGWSDKEKSLFKEQGLKHLNLHDFTLRAETAAIAAVSKLLQ